MKIKLNQIHQRYEMKSFNVNKHWLDIVKTGNVEFVQHYINSNIDINIVYNGQNAAEICCKRNYENILKILLDTKKLDIFDTKPTLITAIEHRRYNCIILLLDYIKNMDPSLIYEKYKGKNPLFYAIKKQDTKIIELLIDVCYPSENNLIDVFQYSISFGDMFWYLFERFKIPKRKNIENQTFLMEFFNYIDEVASFDSESVCEVIEDQKDTINYVDNYGRNTLMYALKINSPRIIDKLLSLTSNSSIDNNGNNEIMFAIYNNCNSRIVSRLIDFCDCELINYHDKNIIDLIYNSETNYPETLKSKIIKKINVNRLARSLNETMINLINNDDIIPGTVIFNEILSYRSIELNLLNPPEYIKKWVVFKNKTRTKAAIKIQRFIRECLYNINGVMYKKLINKYKDNPNFIKS